MKLGALESETERTVREAVSNVSPPDTETAHPRRGRRGTAVAAFTAALVGVGALWGALSEPPAPDPQAVSPPNGAPIGAGPVVTDLIVERPVPLRVLAVRPNNPSFAVVDLETATMTVYPPGEHALPADATGGAVMTPSRELIIWTHGVARLVGDSLDVVDAELRPSRLRVVDGVAPAVRVVPTYDGLAWLVQPGSGRPDDSQPTLVDLVDVSRGRPLGAFEIEGSALPVGATDRGLVLNTSRLIDTGDGISVEPGSERILQLSADGAMTDAGAGQAIAAGPETIVRLACPSAESACELSRDGRLVLSGIDGGDAREVVPPGEGSWVPVGGPLIPSDAMPMGTVSPDGSKLLIAHRAPSETGADGGPATLYVVDLHTAGLTKVRDVDDVPPVATWSSDGQWIAILGHRDLTLVEANDPSLSFALTDIYPEDHFPLAAG